MEKHSIWYKLLKQILCFVLISVIVFGGFPITARAANSVVEINLKNITGNEIVVLNRNVTTSSSAKKPNATVSDIYVITAESGDISLKNNLDFKISASFSSALNSSDFMVLGQGFTNTLNQIVSRKPKLKVTREELISAGFKSEDLNSSALNFYFCYFNFEKKGGNIFAILVQEIASSSLDKSVLSEAINSANSITSENYYDSDDRYNGKSDETIKDKGSGFWKEMQTALSNAKSVNEDSSATQIEVDNALAALTKAAIRLIPKTQLNATALYEAVEIEKARGLVSSDYTNITWTPYQNAKKAAEDYLASLFEIKDGAVKPTEINKAENQELADSYIAPMREAFRNLLKQKEYDNFVNDLTLSGTRWLTQKYAELKPENFTSESWNIWDEAYKNLQLAMEDGYETGTKISRYVGTYINAKEAYYGLEDSRADIKVNVRVQDNYGAKNPKFALDTVSGTYEKEIILSEDKSVGALIRAIEKDGCHITKGGADPSESKNQVFGLLLVNGKLTPRHLFSDSLYNDETKALKLRNGDEVLLLRTVLPTQNYYIHNIPSPYSYMWYQSDVSITTLKSPQLSEKGYVEMEAGTELTVNASKMPASINIEGNKVESFVGATVFISEAKDSKEAAKSSLALTNTGALTDSNGKASFRVLESGWYRLSAVGIGEQKTTDISGDGYVQGNLPNAPVGTYILVHASEPADSSPVKAEFKAELDDLYLKYGEDFYGKEAFVAVKSAYLEACEVLKDSASTIRQAFDAKEKAASEIGKKISETEKKNILVAYQIENFFTCLPKSAKDLNTSNKRHFENLKSLYEDMTEYQRAQLTAAQEKLYKELLEAYGDDGSGLTAGKKHKVRIEIEDESDLGGRAHGIFCRVNGSEKGYYKAAFQGTEIYETELEPGDILDIYFTFRVLNDYPPRMRDVELVSGDGSYKDSSRNSSVGYSSVTNKIEENGYEIYSWQDRLNVVGGNSDTVIRVSFVEKSAPASALDKAKETALAELKTAFDSYSKTEYSGDNWKLLAEAYNSGTVGIRDSDSEEKVADIKATAIKAMAAVKKGFTSNETVGSLGSVHVLIENTTYKEAQFYGKIVEADIPLDSSTTMMTAVLEALERTGFDWKNSTGDKSKKIEYLASISKGGKELGEFDGGPQSGWMGTLNDWFVNEGFQNFKANSASRDYRVVDGDYIHIMYTQSGYGEDLGGTWYNSDTSLKNLSISGGRLYPAFDGAVKEYLLVRNGSDISALPVAANKNYQVKTFINEKNTQRDVDYYRRGENIPVTSGDDIQIGVGERNWLSMNKQGAEARYYTGTWYTIHVIDSESYTAVENLIKAIGRMNYSDYKDKQTAIDMAQKAYEYLSQSAKNQVSNVETLKQATEDLKSYTKIDNVKKLLAEIPVKSKLSKADIAKVKAARNAYDGLNKKEQGYITVGDVTKYNDAVEWLKAQGDTSVSRIGGAEFMPGGEVIVPETTVNGTEAKASVTKTQISEAVKATKAGGSSAVKIAPQNTEGAKSITVSVPKTAAKEIVAEKNLAIEVETFAGTVTVPSEALSSIVESAKGSDIEINIAKKTESDVTDKTVDTSSKMVFSVTITSGGKEINRFGGNSITIDLPVDNRFAEGGKYNVVQISKDGKKEILLGKCIKVSGKLVVRVSTTHLSIFVVQNEKLMSFTDIAGHWAEDGIKYVYGKGIMGGTGDVTFSPEMTLSRAMLVTMLYRLEGEPKIDKPNSFKDVESGKWYADAISWAAANDIVGGFGEGIFAPNQDITREQMAAILYRYSKYKKYDTSKMGELSDFADSSEIKDWALEPIKWAKGEGLISGRTKTAIVPKGTAKRGEAAVILMRFMENVVK